MEQRPFTGGGDQARLRDNALLGFDVRANTGVQIGDGNTQIMHLLPPQAPWPVRVGFPPLVADRYQSRDAEAGLAEPEVVLAGLGGVGKTQLAARHARTAWGNPTQDLVVWINAVTRSAIVSGYAEAAVRALDDIDPRTARRDPEQAAIALLAWLGMTRRRWLIVLDDLRDPADVRGWWPPRTATGQVLVTTRRRDAALVHEDRQLVEVDVFTPAESLSYLEAKLPGHAEPAELRGLADDLGHLPLALAQAAAFIADKPLLSVAAYRARLTDRRRTLAQVMPAATELPDEYRDTVAATWSLSIEHANGMPPEQLARPVLELACLLDPTGIPTRVFTFGATSGYLSTVLAQEVDADLVADALACLHRLSLLTLERNHRARGVRIHALVQRTTRDTVPPERLRPLAQAAADALLENWPDIETDTALAQALRA
ncbi:NB-ARC domain-containing protein, partial [Actinophytocola sp.]|uniref:NB-ARC domain-containing protein n=1 Tax=Actinophytocola sp. TaxID=1872138 RepID=UPI003899D0D8